MALFLKYRPQTFDDVVGQTSLIKTLRNALKNEKPSHAYLFSGVRGTGKTSLARIFAKALNCDSLKEGNPCGKCDICTSISEGNLVDVIEIDGASNRGIDEIRDLREKINFQPNIARRKVYIIDEVHMLTKEAFNALLKTLEEPPSHAFFVLATTELHRLPETIVSRCQTFLFSRFTLEQLTQKLQEICEQESFNAETEALDLIAQKAEGGLRDAISLLEQMAAETDQDITSQAVRESLGISSQQQLEHFWEATRNNDPSKALEVLGDINTKGGDLRTFGHDLLGFLRNKMHENLDQKAALAPILQTIEEIEKALYRLKTSPLVELPFEIAVINLCSGTKKETPTPEKQAPKQEENKSTAPAPKKESLTEKHSEARKPAAVTPPPASTSPQPASPAPTDTSGFVFDNKVSPSPKAAPPTQEIQKEVSTEGNLDTKIVLEKMTLIAEKAGIPIFAKKSFLTTKPKLQGERLVFEAGSNFHREQLTADAIKIALQDVIKDMFQQKILIDFTVSAEAKEELATVDDFLSF